MDGGAVNDDIFNSVINGSAPYTLDIFTRDAVNRGVYVFEASSTFKNATKTYNFSVSLLCIVSSFELPSVIDTLY